MLGKIETSILFLCFCEVNFEFDGSNILEFCKLTKNKDIKQWTCNKRTKEANL